MRDDFWLKAYQHLSHAKNAAETTTESAPIKLDQKTLCGSALIDTKRRLATIEMSLKKRSLLLIGNYSPIGKSDHCENISPEFMLMAIT